MNALDVIVRIVARASLRAEAKHEMLSDSNSQKCVLQFRGASCSLKGAARWNIKRTARPTALATYLRN